MKKLFLLSLFMGLFTLMSNTATAQSIDNRTDCDFEILVTYGLPGCINTGQITLIVPSGAVVPVALPAGTIPIKVDGRYTNAPMCQFFLGRPCTGGALSAVVNCPGAGCGRYAARIRSGVLTLVNF